MVEKRLATEETSKGILICPLGGSLDTNAKLMRCVQLSFFEKLFYVSLRTSQKHVFLNFSSIFSRRVFLLRKNARL